MEDRTGKRPLTQFGRAMNELGVGCRPAHKPQAKGRVERCNGLLQDRLVKAMRLAGVSGIEAGNAYLHEHYLSALNEQFEKPPANASDAHQPVDEAALDRALCLREKRVVSQDHCVSFEGRVLQLDPGRALPSLAGKHVQVEQKPDGSLRVMWKGQAMAYRQIPKRPQRVKSKPTLQERVATHEGPYKPPASHPWRGPAVQRAAPA